MSFESAVQVCNYLGGKITLPENEIEFVNLKSKIDLDNFYISCNNEIWIPIIRSPKNNTQWISQENKSTNLYLPWSMTEPNGESTNENCVAGNLFAKNCKDVKCIEKYCFSCTFQEQAVFTLKGLPMPYQNQVSNSTTFYQQLFCTKVFF